jgi:hypothetical protein
MELRRTLIRNLGIWGDPAVIREANHRFQEFVKDHGAVHPDDQRVILSIVARHADPAAFEQIHAIAKNAKDEAEQQRYFLSLMEVGDPALANRAAEIAMSDEIPPQGARWRFSLIVHLAAQHHELSWATFVENYETLMAPFTKYVPLITAQYIPEYFWDCLPLDRLEAWIRAHVPAEMSANVAHGMETARFNRTQKEILVRAADAYIRGGLTARK